MRLRLLVLEDSDDDTELLLRHLRREGFEVHHRRVETADGIRKAFAEEPWDAVVSDYTMPRLTVAEALGVLHELDVDLPFIVVSGSVGEETAVSAMKAGAHDFFLKGRTTRLGSVIHRELREAELRRERRVALERLRQRERDLEQAVRVRDDFMAIASHELRTPLTPLLLSLTSAMAWLRDRAEKPVDMGRMEKTLGRAVEQIDRLTSLIGDLLDVSRIDAGRLQTSRADVDLVEVVRGVVERLRGPIARARCEVRIVAPPSLRGSWDRTGIDTVMLQLVDNAIKFGSNKPIDVVLENAGTVARASIKDQGIGIARDAQARVFERFERAVSTQHYGGFGLGLWIARTIVEAHGGTIRVASAEGAGATFVVELPLDERAASPAS